MQKGEVGREMERSQNMREREMCVNCDAVSLCCLIFIVMLLLVRNPRRNVNIVVSIKLHQVM